MKRKIFAAALILVLAALITVYVKFGEKPALPHDQTTTTDSGLLTQEDDSSLSSAMEGLIAAEEFDIDANPVFNITLSHDEFFYSEAINVELGFNLKVAESYELFYTLDGTEPNRDKIRYSEPVQLACPLDITAAYSLKVKVYYLSEGEELETETLTHTYFIGKDIDNRFDTLVFSISTDPDNLYGYENGIFVPGKTRDDFIKANPGKTIEVPDPANYNLRGRESERFVYVEVFESDGTRVVTQGAGMRVHGGWSRANTQKSLTLIARKEYDLVANTGKFNYAFFNGAVYWDDSYGLNDTSNIVETNNVVFDSYDMLLLRNSANDAGYAYMRNEVSALLAEKAGLPNATRFRPTAVFVNGVYYGFAWLEELNEEQYLQQNYNAPDTNFAVLDFGESGLNNYSFELDTGPETAHDDFKTVYDMVKNGLTDDADYEKFCSLVDIDNLTLYYAIQCYMDNRDWPRGNMKVWRYYGESDGGNKYLDGKWRFVFFDNEFAWGLYDSPPTKNTLLRLLGRFNINEGGMSNIISALMKRDDFREKFINCLCDLANDTHSSDNVTVAVNDLGALQKNELSHAMKQLSAIYNSWDGLDKNRNDIKNFGRQRPAIIYEQVKELYSLGSTYNVTVKGTEGMKAVLNTIVIDGGQIKSAEYFEEYSVVLTAYESENGYAFKHWTVNGEIVYEREIAINADMCKDGKIEIELTADKQVVSPVIIYEVYSSGNSDYIKVLNHSDTKTSTEGLYLSNDAGNPMKWKFPVVAIEANNELLLICKDNKNLDALMNIALNFNIKDEQMLFISDERGRLLSSVKIPNMNSREVLRFDIDEGLYYIRKAKYTK